jgi:S-adenosylmethionine decarboxylase
MIDVLSACIEDRLLVPVGVHCVLELYGCAFERLNDIAFIKQSLQEASVQAESTLLAQVEHKFHPQGVTALALLAESHISIHTWPETGYAAVDVFTCGQHTKPEKACQYLAEAMQAEKHVLMKIPRRMFKPERQNQEEDFFVSSADVNVLKN